ncbi:hypothetical protein HZB93_04375 [Candidatus Falkowbacteria bacterium]|nr:hypothetical protein [Candidatus Falkowbacteria bacterium]
MVELEEAIGQIGEMQRRANFFIGATELDIEFRERCGAFGQTVVAERGRRPLPLGAILGDEAEQSFYALCLWFRERVGK